MALKTDWILVVFLLAPVPTSGLAAASTMPLPAEAVRSSSPLQRTESQMPGEPEAFVAALKVRANAELRS